MAHIVLMLSLCFCLGELLTFWVQIDALEITRTSQLLQMFFMFLAIDCPDYIPVGLYMQI